ncbi:MAG: LysE family translocator [Sneathiella sp.]|nr:LysE family translocator [Sneathiella sp.]
MVIDSAQFALFLISTLILNITPGPDMIFTAANGMQRGMKAGVVSATGIGFGALVHASFAAVGISALIAASDLAFDILRFAGATYLIWIGVKSFRSGAVRFGNLTVPMMPYSVLFARGVVTNILNPKVALFFIAFLPQFIDPSAGNVALQIFVLGCLVGVSGTFVNGLVGVFAGGAGRLFLQNPTSAKWISRVSGCLLVGLGMRLLFLERN